MQSGVKAAQQGGGVKARNLKSGAIPMLLAAALWAFVILVSATFDASAQETTPEDAIAAEEKAKEQSPVKRAEPTCKPDIGCVTNLPLPRFVTLKGGEGNARRGPGLTHRIDWVFTRPGMPLSLTAEYENWRRVEDQEGAGGWVHYALLSGVRNVVVTTDMAELRATPSDDAPLLAQAEVGVLARVQECSLNWCRVSVEGIKGWLEKSAIWGVKPEETIQ